MILVDVREPERIVEMLKSMGVELHKRRLSIADYVITQKVKLTCDLYKQLRFLQ